LSLIQDTKVTITIYGATERQIHRIRSGS